MSSMAHQYELVFSLLAIASTFIVPLVSVLPYLPRGLTAGPEAFKKPQVSEGIHALPEVSCR